MSQSLPFQAAIPKRLDQIKPGLDNDGNPLIHFEQVLANVTGNGGTCYLIAKLTWGTHDSGKYTDRSDPYAHARVQSRIEK